MSTNTTLVFCIARGFFLHDSGATVYGDLSVLELTQQLPDRLEKVL